MPTEARAALQNGFLHMNGRLLNSLRIVPPTLWASFAFQTARRRAKAPHFSLHKLFGAVIVVLAPLGL